MTQVSPAVVGRLTLRGEGDPRSGKGWVEKAERQLTDQATEGVLDMTTLTALEFHTVDGADRALATIKTSPNRISSMFTMPLSLPGRLADTSPRPAS
jgi:hypothetical protein